MEKSIPFFTRRLMQSLRKYCMTITESKFHGSIENSANYVNTLQIQNTPNPIPMYRVLDNEGKCLKSLVFPIDQEFTIRMYKNMVSLREMDRVLYECQRQGRISFYMTHDGEEATIIGSAAGVNDDDLVFPQYREAGILLWRGLQIEQFVNQCFGNKSDIQKSKHMPIHYGSKKHRFVTVSSPIATQLPQAVGAAYHNKLTKQEQCVITYFGDGASSEGDTHAALNFAATLECPVIFFCRNNGYAISTPVEEQYKSDGIAARAAGYGMPAIKVDGNDIFAVYHATKVARDYVIRNNKPILMEALTYRCGHHSTSDDSLAYRTVDDVNKWKKLDPIARLKSFLINESWWNEEEDLELTKNLRAHVVNIINVAEKVKKPKWDIMFTDVYDEIPQHIKEQRDNMKDHLEKFGQHYPLNEFDNSN